MAELLNLRELMEEAGCSPRQVLDVGAGTGSSLVLFREADRLVCIDRSAGMAARIRRIPVRPVDVIRADACRLPLQTGSVEFVSGIGLTEYLADTGAFLDESKRVLRTGGCLLTTVAPPCFWNTLRNTMGHRIRAIRDGDFETAILARGFRVLGKKRTCMQIQYLLGA